MNGCNRKLGAEQKQIYVLVITRLFVTNAAHLQASIDTATKKMKKLNIIATLNGVKCVI